VAEPTAVNILAAASAGVTPKPAADAEQVTQRVDGGVLEAKSTSRRIKTVDDLLKYIEADLQKYEVSASEATKWEVATAGDDGEPTVTELHRVWVRLKPKAGPSVKECVEAMISAASLPAPTRKAHEARKKRGGLWSMIVISDLHIGSRSWRHATGHDYDVTIAGDIAAKTTSELIERSDKLDVARRSIVLAGDTLHFDTIAGTTTSGTYLDRDSRIQKAIDCASQAIFRAVEQSAATAKTDVVIVPGNHDSAMTWALQKILVERYRNDKRVQVNGEFTSRKYLTYGKCLIGVTHGDKGKKKLAGIMALEAAECWSRCPHREWHVGHLHHQAAEISTIDGVIVRTHPTVVPPDAWHFESGFVGAERAMQGYVYDPAGGLFEVHMAYAESPRIPSKNVSQRTR
jgi:hypothetical protein